LFAQPSKSILTGFRFAGVDDVLAMLLALSASPEEVEVVMISVTYGNVALQR
jgi:inosine-uridine nucleoside N-ribohydrolase